MDYTCPRAATQLQDQPPSHAKRSGYGNPLLVPGSSLTRRVLMRPRLRRHRIAAAAAIAGNKGSGSVTASTDVSVCTGITLPA